MSSITLSDLTKAAADLEALGAIPRQLCTIERRLAEPLFKSVTKMDLPLHHNKFEFGGITFKIVKESFFQPGIEGAIILEPQCSFSSMFPDYTKNIIAENPIMLIRAKD